MFVTWLTSIVRRGVTSLNSMTNQTALRNYLCLASDNKRLDNKSNVTVNWQGTHVKVSRYGPPSELSVATQCLLNLLSNLDEEEANSEPADMLVTLDSRDGLPLPWLRLRNYLWQQQQQCWRRRHQWQSWHLHTAYDDSNNVVGTVTSMTSMKATTPDQCQECQMPNISWHRELNTSTTFVWYHFCVPFIKYDINIFIFTVGILIMWRLMCSPAAELPAASRVQPMQCKATILLPAPSLSSSLWSSSALSSSLSQVPDEYRVANIAIIDRYLLEYQVPEEYGQVSGRVALSSHCHLPIGSLLPANATTVVVMNDHCLLPFITSHQTYCSQRRSNQHEPLCSLAELPHSCVGHWKAS